MRPKRLQPQLIAGALIYFTHMYNIVENSKIDIWGICGINVGVGPCTTQIKKERMVCHDDVLRILPDRQTFAKGKVCLPGNTTDVILLLILGGVGIGMISGESGLFTKANQAVLSYE